MLTRRNYAWTHEEDRRLLLSWGPLKTMDQLVVEFGRGRRALYDRAVELGLGNACPRGYEFVTSAARRTGFPPASLRRILHWAGVQTFEAFSIVPPMEWSRRYVDPERVDDAIAKWLATEPVYVAAHRLGLTNGVVQGIVRRLKKARVVQQKKGRRQHLRVTEEQLHQFRKTG